MIYSKILPEIKNQPVDIYHKPLKKKSITSLYSCTMQQNIFPLQH